MLPHSIAEVPAVTALPKNLLLDLCGLIVGGGSCWKQSRRGQSRGIAICRCVEPQPLMARQGWCAKSDQLSEHNREDTI